MIEDLIAKLKKGAIMFEKKIERLKQGMDLNESSYSELLLGAQGIVESLGYKTSFVNESNSTLDAYPKLIESLSILIRIPIFLYKKDGFFRSIGLMMDYLFNKNKQSIMALINEFKHIIPMISDEAAHEKMAEKMGIDFTEDITRTHFINEEFLNDSLAKDDRRLSPKEIFILVMLPSLEALFAKGVQPLKIGNPVMSLRHQDELLYSIKQLSSLEREKIFIIKDDITSALLNTQYDDDKDMHFVFPFDNFKFRYSFNYENEHGNSGYENEFHIIKRSILDGLGGDDLYLPRKEEYVCYQRVHIRHPKEVVITFDSRVSAISPNMISYEKIKDMSMPYSMMIDSAREIQRALAKNEEEREMLGSYFSIPDNLSKLPLMILMFLSTKNVRTLLDETPEERKKHKPRAGYSSPEGPSYIHFGLSKQSSGDAVSNGGKVRMHEVRRHMRMQACGKNWSERRLTWIEPHTRGGVESNHTQLYMVRT